MNVSSSALLTDLYQLTMLQGYFLEQMEETAVFEFFVRRLPPCRNFLVAAGLEQALEFLEGLEFTAQELEWLKTTGRFRSEFLHSLRELRFTGDVDAMPEGTVFFADEPILRVIAPLPQAQIVETRVINLLHFQTLIASKAVRCVLAAPSKALVEFGLRRAHGGEAGLLAARACNLAGFSATSNVLAGQRFGIPLSGTMAHSFVQAHDDEAQAFEHFARANPDNIVLLLDTYDTEAAARKAADLALCWKKQGLRLKAVRLDSGNLAEHAFNVRKVLDDAGLREVTIFASGNLDEYALQDLIKVRAPIDGFGVGTRIDTASDSSYFDCAYKLQEYAGRPRRKRSEGKETWPGRKQVFRSCGDDGYPAFDMLLLEGEEAPGTPLLVPVMRNGRRVVPPTPLMELRCRVATEVARLPRELRGLERAPAYPVHVSSGLRALAAELDRENGWARRHLCRTNFTPLPSPPATA